MDKDPIKKISEVSDRVHSFAMPNENLDEPVLQLPKSAYAPFVLKVLHDFIEHHALPKDLVLPQGNMMIHKIMSCILDVMVHSMGKEKRDEILKDLHTYKLGLPFDLR